MSTEVLPIESGAKAMPQPHDLLAEGARARNLSTDVAGVKSLVEGIRLIDDTVLTQILFALWDSGFYEYSLSHPQFQVHEAADELNLDATLLQWLLDYLVGRGILQSADGATGLTEHGTRLSNILLQGIMNVYVGGYGPLFANLGRALRKEMSEPEFRNLRSAGHTVKGTEQSICVRTVPAVLKLLSRRRLHGVLHLACRTGEFLIELARSDASIHGIGVDKLAERVAAGEEKAHRFDVASRVRFVTAEVGRDRLPLDERSLKNIEVIAALYLLHEVGRHGRHRIVELLRQLKTMFPRRLLLFMETLPADSAAQSNKPPATFLQLDYLVIHRIRGQGLPLSSATWKSIVLEAGLELLEAQEMFGTGLYLAQL